MLSYWFSERLPFWHVLNLEFQGFSNYMKRRTKKERNSLSQELPELWPLPGWACCSTPAAAARNDCGEPAAATGLKGLWPSKESFPPRSNALHLLTAASSSTRPYSALSPSTGYTRKAKTAREGQDRSNCTWTLMSQEDKCTLSCQDSGFWAYWKEVHNILLGRRDFASCLPL